MMAYAIHSNAWRTCARLEQHPTSLYPTIDWFYASEMRSCHCCKRWSRTLLNFVNLHGAWQFVSVHDLFWKWCWDILLICPHLLCPYESKLYDFCRFFFSLLSIKPLYRFFCWLVYNTMNSENTDAVVNSSSINWRCSII